MIYVWRRRTLRPATTGQRNHNQQSESHSTIARQGWGFRIQGFGNILSFQIIEHFDKYCGYDKAPDRACVHGILTRLYTFSASMQRGLIVVKNHVHAPEGYAFPSYQVLRFTIGKVVYNGTSWHISRHDREHKLHSTTLNFMHDNTRVIVPTIACDSAIRGLRLEQSIGIVYNATFRSVQTDLFVT